MFGNLSHFVVVENAGYPGERDVKASRDIQACIGWMSKHYTNEECIEMHVDICRVSASGERSYEF